MRRARLIIIGLILMAAGGGLLAITDSRETVLVYSAWGLFGVGACMFLGGLYRNLRGGPDGENAGELYHSNTVARLLMQSTITTALADGHLDDEQIDLIVTAGEAILHEHMDKESIRRLAGQIEKSGDAILDEIHEEGRLLNATARKQIIEACVLVLMSDGVIDERETAAVTAIAEHMDYSHEETQALIAAALRGAGQG
ncbi:MAG: hypothetical protein V3S44_03520 [Alphaproteobacteria bacterium]